MKALITRKVGMTSTVGEDGVMQAVTLLSATPNTVIQIKNLENDGYIAIQLGTETAKKPNKAQIGHSKQSNSTPKISREFRLDELDENISVGTQFKADVFNVGDIVHATGISKGKGWAGTIKRHNFHQQRKTHGGNGNVRKPGSIGSMYPQKIFKGKKMSGQMGGDQVTVTNLKVALIDTELNVIGVTGAIPGPRKSIVTIRAAV